MPSRDDIIEGDDQKKKIPVVNKTMENKPVAFNDFQAPFSRLSANWQEELVVDDKVG